MAQQAGERAGAAFDGTGRRRSSGPSSRVPSRIVTSTMAIATAAIADESETLLQCLDADNDDASDWLNEALAVRLQSRRPSEGQIGAGSGEGGSMRSLLAIDAQLAHLSTMLSIARQDTISSMDATMASVATAVPRLELELRLMRDAAATLKTNIERLRQQVDPDGISDKSVTPPNVDGKAASKQAITVLERLAALSALHGRMTAARDVLSLAESWSTLSIDVTAYLADAKYEVAAARLSKAKSSLPVFERTPEFESHKKLLDGLGSTLEGHMTPTVIDAIRDRDVEQCKKLAQVFYTVDRHAQFAQLWRRTRSEGCTAEWSRMGEGGDAADALTSLKRFSNTFVALLEQESKIVGQVFPNSPHESVEKMAEFVLDTMQPDLQQKLDTSLIERHQPSAVEQAVEVHNVLRSAAAGLAKAIGRAERVNSAAFLTPESPTTTRTSGAAHTQLALASPELKARRPSTLASSAGTSGHSRRLSVRRVSGMGMLKSSSADRFELNSDASNTNTASHGVPVPSTRWESLLFTIPVSHGWETKLFDPIVEYQLNYGLLERLHLQHALRSYYDTKPASSALEKETSSDFCLGEDLSKSMLDDVAQAISLADAAVARARSFTYGMDCDGMVACVDDALSSTLAVSKAMLDQRMASVLKASERKAREAAMKTTAVGQSGQTDLDGLYGTEGGVSTASAEGAEWKAFEEGMKLLAELRNVSDQTRALESSIAERFADLADFLLATPITPATTEALQRVCSDASGSCTASFRLLLQASADRLRTGSLLGTLRRIRAITAARARRVSPTLPPPATLLQGAHSSILDQARSLQRHLTSVILSPLMPHLEAYAGLSVWSAHRLPGSVNEYDLAMPTFSLSPTEDMSRIGEALLDLPRLLEVWAELPQFRWGVQGLAYAPFSAKAIFAEQQPFVDVAGRAEAQQGLFDSHDQTTPSPKREKRLSLAAAAGVTSPTIERRSPSGTQHRHSHSIASLPGRNAHGKRQEEQHHADSHSALMAGAVEPGSQSALQSYLTSISLTLVSHLVSLILPSIAQLTGPGASQLAADLEYLLTITSALNVSQQQQQSDQQESRSAADDAENDYVVLLVRSLEAWKDVCWIKDVDGRRLRHLVRTGQAARGANLGEPLAGFEGDEDKLRSLLRSQAFDMVARMRGW